MNKLRIDTGRTFRFPFDIDRRLFLVLAAIFFILAIKPINTFIFPRYNAKFIEKKINQDFEKQYVDFQKTIKEFRSDKINFRNSAPANLEKFKNKSWSLFIYHNDSKVFWSKAIKVDNSFKNISVDSLETYNEYGELGIIIKQKLKITNEQFTVIGKFPIYTQYKIENEYFKSNFSFLKNQKAKPDNFGYRLHNLPFTSANSEIIKIRNTPKFKIVHETNTKNGSDKSFWRFFLSAIPFILFGVSIHTFFKVSVTRNPPLYFGLLLLTIVIMKFIGYYWDLPDNFSDFQLFNTQLYSIKGLSISLGDLFINSILLFWVLFFFIMNVQLKIIKVTHILGKIFLFIILSLALFNSAYLLLYNFQTIVAAEQLNFDLTIYENLNPLLIIGLGTLIVLFMNYVLFIIIFNKYLKFYLKTTFYKYLVPTIACLLAYLFFGHEHLTTIVIIGLWTSGLIFLLNSKFFATKFDFNSYKLIYWLIFLSASCVFLIHYFDTNNEIKSRKYFAESLMNFENKQIEEDLISIGKSISKDSSIVKTPSATKVFDYLYDNHFAKFDSNYNTHCIVNRVSNSTPTESNKENYIAKNSRVISDSTTRIILSNETGQELYNLTTRVGQYVIRFSLAPLNSILASTERYKLFNTLKVKNKYDNASYSYAYYDSNVLVKQTGLDNFPRVLPQNIDNKTAKVNLTKNRRFSEVIAHSTRDNKRKSIVVRKKKNTLYKISTTYAYIFTSLFLLISLYILGNIIARSNLRRKRFINLLGLTLRMRIHLSILLVELVSLTIIGIITILVFAHNAKSEAYSSATNASNEIKNALHKAELNNELHFEPNEAVNLVAFNKIVSPYLKKHNADLNLFNVNGRKIFTTTTNKINNILPNLINPQAYEELRLKSDVPSLQSETIGNLDFYTIYFAFKNKAGIPSVIVEIPNYSSRLTIKQSRANIITMLINIYAFVFLLSSLLAFYITKKLTKSFSKIVTQFSKINLTQTNVPLQWPYSDEIGLLIKEYNRTLVKLENSTALLAKSEREFAWREMARQIAHEIKNPLTPMSLSLQSLQAAIKRNDPNVPELTNKMTTTVLEQIKVLTRTATNFSEFATLTDIDAKKESLLEILDSTTGIYSDNDEIEFLFVFPKLDVHVKVDKVKIIRVLTNIIQNAIQSIPRNRVGQIILMASKQSNNFIDITIKDNGEGISDDLKDKIFQPNFTTKSKGSGLGLAMCKDILTKTGGNIFFESTEGEGSTFHILLPIFLEEEEDYET